MFRRAQANREFGDLEAARGALKRIEELDPSNKAPLCSLNYCECEERALILILNPKAVVREYALVERAQKKHDKKAKGTYTKMFA